MGCGVCQKERVRRRRVLGPQLGVSEEQRRDGFAEAPCVHPHNVPKYHMLTAESHRFVRAPLMQLLWCVAEDWLLTMDDESLPVDALQELRESCLLARDQRANRIMGILPAALNMSARLIQTARPE